MHTLRFNRTSPPPEARLLSAIKRIADRITSARHTLWPKLYTLAVDLLVDAL